MARALIRPFPLYANGLKVAEVSGGTYEIASGDEMQIATDGYLGHSDGATTTKVSPSCIIPVKGMKVTVDSILLGPASVSQLEEGCRACSRGLSPEVRGVVDALYRAWLGSDTYYVR